jgi:hypothetical protein
MLTESEYSIIDRALGALHTMIMADALFIEKISTPKKLLLYLITNSRMFNDFWNNAGKVKKLIILGILVGFIKINRQSENTPPERYRSL